MNAPLEVIPEHLQEYITEQNSSLYTAIDQAVWRYVMRFFLNMDIHFMRKG
jgi:phenylalanine-4-hydroxylase